jgi:zinc transport system permease protein
MIECAHRVIEYCLPFEWVRYDFMKNALLATCLITPLFALLGTMVIGNRMAFFSDVLGHSALTGIAIGVILGLVNPLPAMIAFAILLAIGFSVLKQITRASPDTVLGVFLAATVALGVVILSRGGGFSKFTVYLIGDILAVTPAQMKLLLLLLALAVCYWLAAGNAMSLLCVNPSLARSRGLPVVLIEISFAALLAVVVSSSIRMLGILIINSLLILPAAAARNVATSMRSYTAWAIGISIASGLIGLIFSYYWGTASGATIVLCAAACYCGTAIWSYGRRHLRRRG